jgi:signal transduction histidine kinase
MPVRKAKISIGYVAILSTAFAGALCASWSGFSEPVDGNAYDWYFQRVRPDTDPVHAVILAFDEQTLSKTGGMPELRRTLAATLEKLKEAGPRSVAIDLMLADAHRDKGLDARLAAALASTKNLVLGADIVSEPETWEEPLPPFAKHAAAIGHVYVQTNPIARVLPLEMALGHMRHWALSLEAFRLYSGGETIEESPTDIRVGGLLIPAKRSEGRPLWIRYLRGNPEGSSRIPIIPISKFLSGDPSQQTSIRDKAVFIGVTAQSAARDRLMTPLERVLSGLEIHAQAFETLARGRILRTASYGLLAGVCLLLVLAAGATFALLTGLRAYAVGVGILLAAHTIPGFAFSRGIVFPYLAPVFAAWFSVVGAAAWMYFVTRMQLRKSESDKARYQQAIHFVTHEMRSPLTAIQGSSEMMGRYNLNDDKRKQMAQMINTESKRLAKMIQTFLDLERLSDGKLDIRQESFDVRNVLTTCVDRVRPLADRKQIDIRVERDDALPLTGDQELMEYAVYNLLTNAVKYSPPETLVVIRTFHSGDQLRLSVSDQGIGMDEKELKNIFKKFYRTKKAETSGEVGTGIGLSIVEQIMHHHGGKMEVTSVPGKGSCFTMVLPRGVTPAETPVSEQLSR